MAAIERTTFEGGPLDGKVKRLVGAGARLRAWKHRQAQGLVELDRPGLGQPELWEPFDYERVGVGIGRALYRYVEGGTEENPNG